MGPGISNYFKLIKALTWQFCIYSVLAVPMMLLLAFGAPGSSLGEAAALAEVSLGQLGDTLNVTMVSVLGTDCAAEGASAVACEITKLEAAQVFVACDLAAVAVLAIAYVWVRVMEKREAAVVDQDHVTVQDYTVHVTSVPPFTKPEHVRAHFEELLGPGSVAEVHVAEDDAELLRIFVKRGRLIKRVTDLTEQQAKAHARGDDKKEERLQERRTRLKEKIAEMNRSARAVKANNRALAAFVTLDKHSDFRRVVKGYRTGGFCGYLCQPMAMRLKVPDPTAKPRRRLAAATATATPESDLPVQVVRMRVKAAPPPSTILWHNLHVLRGARMRRRATTALISGVLLVLSIVAGFGASVQQNTAVQSSSATCDAGATREDLEAAATVPDATDHAVSCFCARLSEVDAVALASGSYRSLCASWATEVLLATVATIAAAALVPVVNGVFRLLLKWMAAWEAHHSINSQANSFSQRLFLLTVINTAILPLCINAAIPGLEFIPGNKFSDFVPAWYATVGVQLTLTMMINVVSPHAAPIFRYLYALLCLRGCCVGSCFAVACFSDPGSRAASQRQLNSWFEGPQFHLDTRYASVMQTVVVTLIFSALMPLLAPIAFLNLLVSFYVDKWLLLRYYRTPPHYDIHLGRTMTAWIPWALFAHLAIAAYAMSTPEIFASAGGSGVTGSVATVAGAVGGEARTIAARLAQPHVLALSIAACVALGLIILSRFLSGMTRAARAACTFITCGFCDVQDSDDEEPACSKATFSEVRAAGQLDGVTSYNLMDNPDIADALAVNPDMAMRKKRIVELRDELPEDGPMPSPRTSADDDSKTAASRQPELVAVVSRLGLLGESTRAPSPGAATSVDAAPSPAPKPAAPSPRPPVEEPSDDDEPVHEWEDADAEAGGIRPHASSSGFDAIRRDVFGSSAAADAWTAAVEGRAARRAEAEEEAREDLRLMGRDVSSRMLAAWRRGEEGAAEPRRPPQSRMSRVGSGMVVEPAGSAVRRVGSGMVVEPAGAAGAAAGHPADFDFDGDSDSDDGGGVEDDWDVDPSQPIMWTGDRGVLHPHSDADGGERAD